MSISDEIVDCPNPAETGLFRIGEMVCLTPSPSSLHLLS
jgi:hypothetical protein